MLELAVKIAGIVVTFFSTVVKTVELLQKAKDKHQKSNRPPKV